MLTFQCQNRWKRIGIISRKLAVASWNYSATKGVGVSPTQWFFTRTPPPQAPGAFSIGVGSSRWSRAQVLPGLQVICIQHIKIPSCFHPPLGQVFCLAQKHCFTARLPLINLFEAELDFQGVLILHTVQKSEVPALVLCLYRFCPPPTHLKTSKILPPHTKVMQDLFVSIDEGPWMWGPKHHGTYCCSGTRFLCVSFCPKLCRCDWKVGVKGGTAEGCD